MSLVVPGLLAIAIGIPAVWWLSARPHYLASLLAFCIYTHLFDVLDHVHGFPPLRNATVVVVACLMLFRWLLLGDRIGRGWHASLGFYAAWVALALGALLVAVDTPIALEGLEDTLQSGLLLVVMPMLIRTREGIRSALWGLILAGLFLGVLTTLQHVTGDFGSDYGGFAQIAPSGESTGGRASGPTDTNYFGLFLVVLIPIAIDRALVGGQSMMRVLAGVSAAVVTLAIFYTYSRGAALTLAAVLLLSLIRSPHRVRLAAAGAAVLVLGASLWGAWDTLVSRLSRIGEVALVSQGYTFGDAAISGRISEMTAAAMMFSDHPWFGVGHWNFNGHYADYAQEIGLDARVDRSAHSLYLEVAAESGVVGLLLLLLTFSYAFWCIISARGSLLQAGHWRDASGVSAFGIGLVGFLLGSILLHLTHSQYMWMLLGIAFSLPYASRNEFELAPYVRATSGMGLSPSRAGA